MVKSFTLSIALKGGKAPEAIRLFKWGQNETTKGVFVLDKKGAADCLAKFKAWGNALTLDYEHNTVAPVANGPIISAGWVEQGAMYTDSEGIWQKVQWTELARTLMEKKPPELRYYSPTFNVDDDNRVVEIMPTAVTNYPATVAMPQLLARLRANRRKVPVMSKKLFVGLTLAMAALAAAMDAMTPAVKEKFGEDAEVVEIADAEVTYSQGDKTFKVAYTADDAGVITFTGEPVEAAAEAASVAAPGVTPAAVATSARGFVTASAFNALAAQVAGLQTQLAQKDDVAAIVASMKTAKTWTPAREAQVKQIAASMGIKLARENAAQFGPGVKLANDGEGETREPQVVEEPADPKAKKWEAFTPAELHKLHNEDPKAYSRTLSEYQSRTRRSA